VQKNGLRHIFGQVRNPQRPAGAPSNRPGRCSGRLAPGTQIRSRFRRIELVVRGCRSFQFTSKPPPSHLTEQSLCPNPSRGSPLQLAAVKRFNESPVLGIIRLIIFTKMKRPVSVIVTDLDNTLYDWVGVWHASFSAMLATLSNESQVPIETLEREFRSIFQKHGTSEYAFAIQELPSLHAKHPGSTDLAGVYKPAVDAYRASRRETLRPYPDVLETLETLKDKGCLLVGYTESMAFYTNDRLRRLGLDRILDYLYSPPDHELPGKLTAGQIRFYPKDHYVLRRTISRETPRGELKPNPALLLDIIKSVGATPERVVYVGDSPMKDVAMAQEAGVLDVWAKYGAAQERPEYELLRRVSHWKQEDVEREKELLKKNRVIPTCTLNASFKELLDYIDPTQFRDNGPDRLKNVIEAWKKTVDVQQHFNDLELRIRNYAITLVTAVVGVASFALKENLTIRLFGFRTSLAAVLLGAGAGGWLAFYLMDRLWYHNLLVGAVRHGSFIERAYEKEFPELRLTHAISEASPTRMSKRLVLHSSQKLNLFYVIVGLILAVSAVAIHLTMPSATQSPANAGPSFGTNATANRHPSP
jgi:phosphoglycolate phosphatase-like HAD superfamily hydrolase